MSFTHCDFRRADLAGTIVDSTWFKRCCLSSLRGRPRIEGSYFIEAADLSADFDGSLIDSAAIERAWGPPPARDAND